MEKAFYVMKLWQTGNVGPHNICKVEEQPENGFLFYDDAEKWLKNNIDKISIILYTFVIMTVYHKTK